MDGGMDRDAGEPAHKTHTPTRQVVLTLKGVSP